MQQKSEGFYLIGLLCIDYVKLFHSKDKDSCPVFSSEGVLLGILSGGGKSNDYVQYPLMNSRIVPIDYLKIHLGNYLMKRKSNLRACRLSIEN